MNITQLSDTFEVRRLNAEDVDLIYTLSIENEIFYQYHPPFRPAKPWKTNFISAFSTERY